MTRGWADGAEELGYTLLLLVLPAIPSPKLFSVFVSPLSVAAAVEKAFIALASGLLVLEVPMLLLLLFAVLTTGLRLVLIVGRGLEVVCGTVFD